MIFKTRCKSTSRNRTIFVLSNEPLVNTDLQKLENNKKFIMKFVMEMVRNNGSEETVRKYSTNEDYIRGVLTFRKGFPDYTIFIEDITAEGDMVVIHGVIRGTHTGDFNGFPPSNKKIEVPIIGKYRIVNNMIVEAWPLADQMKLLGQIGVIK